MTDEELLAEIRGWLDRQVEDDHDDWYVLDKIRDLCDEQDPDAREHCYK